MAKCDYYFFTRLSGSTCLALLAHVDDVIVASNDLKAIHDIKSVFHNTFQIKDLDDL